MTDKIDKLGDCWVSTLDNIVQYLKPQECFKFAKTSKKKLEYVKTYLNRVQEDYTDYGFSEVCTPGESTLKLKFKLPHEKCLLRVWEIEGSRGFMQITSDTCHFWGGPATQFANNALIRIIKITQESEYRIKVYGWVLSGAGTYMTKGKQEPYFRSYPFWSYITIHNYKRFRLWPYRKKEK